MRDILYNFKLFYQAFAKAHALSGGGVFRLREK